MGLTSIPQNYRENVKWILGAYEDAGVSFPNGFQKDAIQNAAGARRNKKWDGWKCDISFIENERGRFVIVEDSGTWGLTGKNISSEEINAMMAKEETLKAEERLSRFTSMFNSGGNTSGGGLYGAGKSVYSVASEKYIYYFDSLRDDGKYLANVNNGGQVHSIAFEDDAAREFILKNTGFKAKTLVGTRIIIVSPKEELVEAIQSGSIIDDIQESWWRIISRLPDNAEITVNGKRVIVPKEFFEGTYRYDLSTAELYEHDRGYRVKNFGMYVFEDGRNKWTGLSYYRKGMKIGEVDLTDIPKKLENKFWGYIEVDEEWEEGLAEIEDKVHFGVSKGKKKRKEYQNLKNYCNKKVTDCLINWGYIKNQEAQDNKLQAELEKIAEDIQDLFGQLGFEDLGKGAKKTDFEVRLQNISYPVKNTEKVSVGDVIKFSARIKNSYKVDKNFKYILSVVDPEDNSTVYSMSKEFKVLAGDVEIIDFEHKVTKTNSNQFKENKLRLLVKVLDSGKQKRKELSYFFDVDKPDRSIEKAKLYLHECIFPNESSKRINFGESLKNVSYLVENKRNEQLNYRINISIHNASDERSPKIVDIASLTGILDPFEEEITNPIDKITFDSDIYGKYLEKGILELRARLIANEADLEYEKGDKITHYHYKIFLNLDEKHGNKDSFSIKLLKNFETSKRAWHTPGRDRSITLNIGHPAYLNLELYPELQLNYLREQMMREYVLLYLSEGRYDMFAEMEKEFNSFEPQEAVEIVLKKIDNVYYESLKS